MPTMIRHQPKNPVEPVLMQRPGDRLDRDEPPAPFLRVVEAGVNAVDLKSLVKDHRGHTGQ
jgi:hypothetical protein